MTAGRLARYRTRVQDTLRSAFSEDHPPHHIAVSFAVGLFFTGLPTLGSAVVLLAWIGYYFEWANNLALFAAVAILNPMAKTGFHAVSFGIGTVLFGPMPDVSTADLGPSAGSAVLLRLLVGNAILSFASAVVGYVVAYRTALEYRRRRSNDHSTNPSSS